MIKKIKSQGLWWKIRLTDDIEDLGQTDHDSQEILIRKSLSPEMQDAVLFHEIGHTLNTTVSHALLDSLASQYYQVIKDNNLWKK